MLYKSPCRACTHKHERTLCNAVIKEKGTIKLKPYSSFLWNEDCGSVTQEFEYEQEFDCRCRCYIPTENLEFLEWKYDDSTNK